MIEQLYLLLRQFTYYVVDVQTREVTLRVGVRDFRLSHGKIVADHLVIDNVDGFKVSTDEDGWTVISLDYIRIYCR